MDSKPSFSPKLRRFFNALAFSLLLLTLFARLASFFSFSLGISQPQLNRAAFWLIIFTALINWRQIVAFLVYLFPHSKSAKKFLLLTGANLLLVLIFLVGYAIFQYGSPLVYESHPKSFKTAKEVPLVENTLISQEFTADSNNLGTVGVRLSVQEKILGFDEAGEIVEIKPEEEIEEEIIDQETQKEQPIGQDDLAEEEPLEEIAYYEPAEIIFRIKEKGAENWFYENAYYFDQTAPSHLYPFGFPIIEDSKDKTYLVEIEGQKEIVPEEKELYLFTSVDKNNQPYLYSRYVYTRQNLKKDWRPILENVFFKKINQLYKNDINSLNLIFIFLVNQIFIFLFVRKRDSNYEKKIITIVKYLFIYSLFTLVIIPPLFLITGNNLLETIINFSSRFMIVIILAFVYSGVFLLKFNQEGKKIPEIENTPFHKNKNSYNEKKYVFFILLIITVIGVLLRLAYIKNLSIWHDEAITISVAKNIRDGLGHIRIDGSIYNRAYLYHSYLSLFFRLTEETWIGIIANIPFYMTSSVFIFLLGKEILNRKTGLIASFLFAFSWANIAMAREIRFYEFFLCLFVIGVYFLFRSIKTHFLYQTKKDKHLLIKTLLFFCLSAFFFLFSLMQHELTFFIAYPILLFGIILFLKNIKNAEIFIIVPFFLIVFGCLYQYGLPRDLTNFFKFPMQGWFNTFYERANFWSFFYYLIKTGYWYLPVTVIVSLFFITISRKEAFLGLTFSLSVFIGLYSAVSFQGVGYPELFRYYYMIFPFLFLNTGYVILFLIKSGHRRINFFSFLLLGIISAASIKFGLQESVSAKTLTSNFGAKNVPSKNISRIITLPQFSQYMVVSDNTFPLINYIYGGKNISFNLERRDVLTAKNERFTGAQGINCKELVSKIESGEKIIFVNVEARFEQIHDCLLNISKKPEILLEHTIDGKKVFLEKYN